MKITSQVIGTSLMFATVTNGKTRTAPPVQTLSNLHAMMDARRAEVLTFQQAHEQANLAIRTALKANMPTAAARTQLADATACIDGCMTEVNELQSLIDEVTAATIHHDAQALTQQLQADLDATLKPFDLAQLDQTESQK